MELVIAIENNGIIDNTLPLQYNGVEYKNCIKIIRRVTMYCNIPLFRLSHFNRQITSKLYINRKSVSNKTSFVSKKASCDSYKPYLDTRVFEILRWPLFFKWNYTFLMHHQIHFSIIYKRVYSQLNRKITSLENMLTLFL